MGKDVKEGKKKSTVGVTIFVIILLVLFAVGGWFGNELYRAGKDASKKTTEKKEKKEVVEDGSLDINSDLVKDLYSKVTDYEYTDDMGSYRSCEKNWLYGTSDNGYKEEFDVETALPEEKANFVFRNLEKSKGTVESCDDLKIPERVDSFYSVCAFNKEINPIGEEVSFKVDYVKSVYEDIFGKDDKFNSNLILKGPGNIVQFLNIEGKYYEYITIGGSVCGPVRYVDKITKAEKDSNTIKIYEDEEYFEENVSKGIKHFIYTFKKDGDSYSFVSRKKV